LSNIRQRIDNSSDAESPSTVKQRNYGTLGSPNGSVIISQLDLTYEPRHVFSGFRRELLAFITERGHATKDLARNLTLKKLDNNLVFLIPLVSVSTQSVAGLDSTLLAS
jgi:hypothetical protein